MKTRTILGCLLVLSSSGLASCTGSSATAPTTVTPSGPSSEPIAPLPPVGPTVPALFHNVPADYNGTIVWVCTTQLRTYMDHTGKTSEIRDHYISLERCPEEPIR
jgi:hypothetical protein